MDHHDFRTRQHDLLVAGKKIAYYAEGEGEPVVLLHGYPTWSFLWHEIIPQLSPDFLVLAPDLLGYGSSDRRDILDRSIKAQTEMIFGLMDQLRIPAASLVGHGFGGGIALSMAVNHLSRVKRLVLMDSVCYDCWPHENLLRFGNPKLAGQLTPEELNREVINLIRHGIHRTRRVSDDWLEAIADPFSDDEGVTSFIRNTVSLNTNHTLELTPYLQGISIPTLILWGENDPFFHPTFGRRLARDIPNASLTVVKIASHYLMTDRPEIVGGHILRFLRKE